MKENREEKVGLSLISQWALVDACKADATVIQVFLTALDE